MLPIIFALVALFGWGVGDIFVTFATRKIGSYSSSFYGYFFGLLVSTAYVPFALAHLASLSVQMVLLTIILSIIQIFAFLAYNEGLRVGSPSLVGTISGSFTAIVVILSLLFLGESLSAPSITAIVVIFLGLFLSSINFEELKEKRLMNKGTLLSLVAMVGWGLYFTFIKLPVKESGFFWPSYITVIVGTTCLFVCGIHKIRRPRLGLRSGFPAAFISAILLTAGSFGFNLAIESGLSSIVAPIAGAYPALFAFLAYFIFQDPITKQQKLGMLITLLGITSLAYIGG